MNKISSFTVNHLDLLCGAYVSRTDNINGNILTTFDIRVTRPNVEPVMDTCAAHAIEHLGATFCRNDPRFADKTVYFGPMGCRTGFYLILVGELSPNDIKPLLDDMFDFIINYEFESVNGKILCAKIQIRSA